MLHPLVTKNHITEFQRDGVTLINELFTDHVDHLRAGIKRNMTGPGPWHQDGPYYFVEGTQIVSFWSHLARCRGDLTVDTSTQ